MLTEIVLCALVGGVILYWMMRTSSSRQSIPLDGKVIIVTGCDTGFGNALARRLDSLGCTVFAGCLYPTEGGAEELRKESSARLKILHLDVTKDESVQSAKKDVENYLSTSGSHLWAVVNNAGILIRGHIELLPMKMFQKVAEVNLFGTIRVTKAFLPFIRHAKGRVVNVSSVHGRSSSPACGCYDISKHGIESFSDVLRLEMRKFGVKVSIIEPGRFGHATGIASGKAKETHLRALEESWREADDEVKSVPVYKKTFESIRKNLTSKDSPVVYTQSVEPVITVLLHALCSPTPRERYLVAGNEKFIDSKWVLAAVSSFLPTSWMDRLTLYVTGY